MIMTGLEDISQTFKGGVVWIYATKEYKKDKHE